MSLLFAGFLLALFGLSVVLLTLSLRLLRGTAPPGDAYPTPARFFLVALRLAIGWHCFVEGMEKINTPGWTSETYLRESVGPLSGGFRALAGDRLIAKATLGAEDAFPAELERGWRDYFNAFAAHYDLDKEQRERAQGILEQRMKDTQTVLLSKTESVIRLSPYPPELKLDMTMKQRLKEYEGFLERVRVAEAKFPSSDKDVHSEWKGAKADLAIWRDEIRKTIYIETAKLKTTDKTATATVKKTIEAETVKWNKTDDPAAKAKIKKVIDEESAKLWTPLEDVLTTEQRERGPLPDVIRVPLTSWRLLEISDFLVKWSLVVLGTSLLLGLFARATSLATALLLLSFYAAMPPLPGWPEGPRLEGHYLLINKTLIEVIALLALTFIPTGRWAGLDALLCLCCCGKAKAPEKP